MSKSTTATTKGTNQPVSKPTAATPQGSTSCATVTPSVPTEKIAQRAYEKWTSRGCTHGNDMQDWHEAELELKAELAKKANATAPARR